MLQYDAQTYKGGDSMIKLQEDLSLLTGIPFDNFVKLNQKICSLVGHYVCEAMFDKKEYTEIDLGIGYLYIKWDKDNAVYKFVPSKRMIMNVKKAYELKESSLNTSIDESLRDRITNTYKELL